METYNLEGFFFKLSDLYFFKGVNYFYLNNFEKSYKNFNKSLELKK